MKARLVALTFVVILLAAVFTNAQAEPGRKYLTLNRDPKVPGGITAEQLKQGQKIGVLPFDTYVTGMYGSHSGPASGWLPKGTKVVYREVQTKDAQGRTIYAWKIEAAQPCGNDHQPAHVPAPSPPCKPEVRIEKQYIPGPTQYVQVPGPVQIQTQLVYPVLPRNPVPDVQAQLYMVSHDGIGTGLIRAAGQIGGAPRVNITQNQNAPANLSAVGTGTGVAAADASAAATASQEQGQGTTVVVTKEK